MTIARTPGRRPGASTTREDLLAAARAEFAASGYDRATVRAIASRAGVDPAMIKHHFGSKQGLFAAAVALPFNPADLVADIFTGNRDHLGQRLALAFLTMWDTAGGDAAVSLLRTAMHSKQATEQLRSFLIEEVMRRGFTELMGWTPAAQWRANLVASQLVGLLVTRYIVQLEPLASAPREEIARAVGLNLQRYLTGDVPGPN